MVSYSTDQKLMLVDVELARDPFSDGRDGGGCHGSGTWCAVQAADRPRCWEG